MHWLALLFATIVAPPINLQVQGQVSGYQAFKAFTTSVPASDTGVNLILTGIGFHQITWTVTGSPASCTVAVDGSTDGISFSAGSIIANQTCTSNGQATPTNVVIQFVRIRVVALSAGATLSTAYTGYVTNPSSSGTIAGISGATRGQATVGTQGGNLFSDGLLSLDVKAYNNAGALDMCQAIANCFSFASPLYGCNASSYTATQACSVNPFPQTNATPLYLGPDVLIQAAVPWVVPSATPILGADLPTASAPGTVIQATAALEAHRVTAITSYSITSNVATFTANHFWSAGQTVTLSGFTGTAGADTFLNGLQVVVCAGLACANSGNGLTATQFQATVVHADITGSSTGVGTGNVPLISWGSFGTGGSGGVTGGGQFNSGITSLRIDCFSKAVTGLYVFAAQEHSYARNVQVIDCGNATNPAIMVDIESSHSQHFTLDHDQIFNKTATSCNAGDNLLVINGGVDTSIDYMTMTTQGCDNSIDFAFLPLNEILVDGSQNIVFGPHYVHLEGPQGTSPTGTPVSQNAIVLGAVTGNNGVKIDGFSGGNYQNEAAGSTGVAIANNANRNIQIVNVNPKGSNLTNMIVDSQNGNTITRSNNPTFGEYSFNNSTPITDAVPEAGITNVIFKNRQAPSVQVGLLNNTQQVALGAQTSATCTTITGMSWPLMANRNYKLHCDIPRNLAASATMQYCLAGPGVPTGYSVTVDGMNGAGPVFNQNVLLGSTAYGTKTPASNANANNSVDHLDAMIQNVSVSGTNLQVQTAANGTNAITVGASASCILTQIN
jgi:hypothetical protein